MYDNVSDGVSMMCSLPGLLKAPHKRQLAEWDCGIACVEMILCSIGLELDRDVIVQSISTSSIWTIDLAMFLNSCGIKFVFFTRSTGASSSYKLLDFYRVQFEQDTKRVTQRFMEAIELGLSIRVASLSIKDIIRLVQNEWCVIIILVDARLLPHHIDFNHDKSSYRGHYLILIGYSFDHGMFIVRDPAVHDGVVMLHSTVLDSSRLRFGTDEDLIVIDLNMRDRPNVSKSPNHEKKVDNLSQFLSELQEDLPYQSYREKFASDGKLMKILPLGWEFINCLKAGLETLKDLAFEMSRNIGILRNW